MVDPVVPSRGLERSGKLAVPTVEGFVLRFLLTSSTSYGSYGLSTSSTASREIAFNSLRSGDDRERMG